MMGEAQGDDSRKQRLLKFLGMALGERRGAFGIRPDREGYVPLMDLMGAILDEPDFSWVTLKDVEEAVGSTRPPGFEIRGGRIRPVGQGGAAPARRSRRRRKVKAKEPAPPVQTRTAAQAPNSAAGDPPHAKKRRRRRRRKPGPGQPPEQG
jgi:RNA:NAD 2'-phosphotransferase (TPT1/KptA family)